METEGRADGVRVEDRKRTLKEYSGRGPERGICVKVILLESLKQPGIEIPKRASKRAPPVWRRLGVVVGSTQNR